MHTRTTLLAAGLFALGLFAWTGPALAADFAPTLDVPAIDRAAALAEDDVREAQGLPPRFALAAEVGATPETHGAWRHLPDGAWAWQLRVRAAGALSVNLGLDEFRLPKGGRLVLRPAGEGRAHEFTEFDNEDHGQLWTPVVIGEEMLVELTLPPESRHDYALRIATVNGGYRFFGEAEKSGACNVDVVCPEGDAWRDQIDSNAVYTLNGIWMCSGSMVNNTAQDGTPYFLTANHCGISPGNAASVVIYWNFQSPTCGQHGGGSLAQYSSGTIFRAAYAASDFCLVELEEVPDPAFNVTFAGWDRSDADAQWAVAIHHPSTDEKSISFEDDPTTTTGYLGTTVPGDGTHVRVTDWDLGTTEPGSSGSPLYDQNQRVIGQLHGGYAACSNDLSDWYGRFSVSWNGGGSDASRLSTWLDPLGTAPLALDLFDPDASGLRVLGAPFAAMGDVGGPFAPESASYTLENNGDAPLSYQVTVDVAWLEVADGTGALSPGASTVVTVALTPEAAALPAGVYEGTISFVNLTDGDGDTTRPARLQVGVPEVAHSFTFDSDPGWSTQGLWAFGDPQGLGGDHGGPDPQNAYTGANVYGYNLAGDYTNNMPEYHLTSTAIDCSALQAVSLRFRRWLGVEQPSYDHAYVRASNDGVNWTTVWENGAEITDDQWELVEIDLSAIADGQPTLYLRWTMGTTDGSWLYCGWNIDDVEILGIGGGTVAVGDAPRAAAALLGAAPNPFNPRTEVRFELARPGRATLTVHDPRGRLVRTLADDVLAAGPHVAPWDGLDDAGRRAASGVYFLRLVAGGEAHAGKVVLMK